MISIIIFFETAFSQADATRFLDTFFTPSDTFSKPRFYAVVGTEAVLYTSATIMLYQYWYKDYPLTNFHFFDDNGEWLQYDKFGHLYTAYFETNITTGFYKWAGMKPAKAYWAGALTGSILQLTIEVFDGFSEKWGFSLGDFAMNTLGAGISTGQNYLWDEQRMRIKFSSHFTDYSGYDTIVQNRVQSLFGSSSAEKVLKDYNGQTTWLSLNPSMFMKDDTPFPKWLMLSAGYSVEGLLGGYENKWCPDPNMKPEDCPPELLIDYSNIERNRQFYLSVDVDFSQIKTKSEFINALFGVVNIVKVPAPALEFSGKGTVTFKPLYF
jgi:hypothetical protein